MKQKLDAFLEFSSFFHDATDVGNFISDSSAFSKSSLYIWKFLFHVLLKPSLKDFERYLCSKWNEHIVWYLELFLNFLRIYQLKEVYILLGESERYSFDEK